MNQAFDTAAPFSSAPRSHSVPSAAMCAIQGDGRGMRRSAAANNGACGDGAACPAASVPTGNVPADSVPAGSLRVKCACSGTQICLQTNQRASAPRVMAPSPAGEVVPRAGNPAGTAEIVTGSKTSPV